MEDVLQLQAVTATSLPTALLGTCIMQSLVFSLFASGFGATLLKHSRQTTGYLKEIKILKSSFKNITSLKLLGREVFETKRNTDVLERSTDSRKDIK